MSILENMEKEFGPVTSTKTPNEVKKSVNDITSGETFISTPVTSGSQEAINRRNTIKIESFDKEYNKFIELYNKIKEKSASPETKIPRLQSDYYVLQKKKNATMASYNRINRGKISVRGLSSINAKKSDITSKLAEIRANINTRQRALLPGRRVLINPLAELQSSQEVPTQQTILQRSTTNRNANSPMRIMNNINNSNPPASAATPDPVPASPPAPPQIPLSKRTRTIPRNPFAKNALKPNAQPPSTNRRTVLGSTQKTNNTAIRITNAPEEQPAPPLSSNLQNNTNLENARTRAQNLIDKSLLGKQPTISKMYTNTRKKSNKNALKNRSLASLYPNMNSFEEQPAPINAPQPQSQTNPNAPAVNIDLLGTLEEKYNIVAKPNSSTRERIRALNSTMKEQHAKYIQTMPDKIVYKIVDIDTSNDTAKVLPLDRVTKMWGPVEQLTKEQINSSRIVDCNSQAGGRRTCRRRPQRKHRKTRRA